VLFFDKVRSLFAEQLDLVMLTYLVVLLSKGEILGDKNSFMKKKK